MPFISFLDTDAGTATPAAPANENVNVSNTNASTQSGTTPNNNISQSAAPGWMSFVPFILIIVIFYFFLIRPQSKKQKETQRMLNSLKKGDKVVTIGGIHGVVSSVKDNTIVLKVDDNCKMEFTRSAIAACETVKTDDAKADKKSKKEEKAEESEAAESTGSADETNA